MHFFLRHLPNLFTLANLFLGCLATFYSFSGHLSSAFGLMLVAMGCDVLDGYLARLLKVDGALGVQLDSLADVVTFGVAPGAMVTHMLSIAAPSPAWLSYAGFIIPIGSAWRLARFNILRYDHQDFVGLATPSAAMLTGGLALVFHLHPELRQIFTVPVLLFLTISVVTLMNIPLRMFSLKSRDARGWMLGLAAMAVILVIFLHEWAFALTIVGYILLSLLRRLVSP